jgi:hypothetical protein
VIGDADAEDLAGGDEAAGEGPVVGGGRLARFFAGSAGILPASSDRLPAATGGRDACLRGV